MQRLRLVTLSMVTIVGCIASLVSGYYVLQDWAALNLYYARFEDLTMSASDMRSLFIAEANQNAFRINCFADGVGVLLGAVIAAIGIHGLCLLRSADSPTAQMSA